MTFDFSQKQLSLFYNGQQVGPSLLNHEMLAKWNAITEWDAIVGYVDGIERATNGNKMIEIFRPPLTISQMQMIQARKVTSHLKGSMNLKAGITNSYNALVWNTVKQVTAFSIT